MNGALFFAELPPTEQLDVSSLLARKIAFIDGLDYTATADDDLTDLHLDRNSVLSADAELRIFTQMNRCYYYAAKFHNRDDGDADPIGEDSFVRELMRGDELRNQLLLVFHKLTVSIAKNFVSSRHSLEELVSEGNAALIRAITLFDPSRGFRFSTYSTYAIRRCLARYVSSSQHTYATPVDFRSAPPLADQRRWTLPYQHAMESGVEWLESALYELTARERYIVRCRFGWGREFEPRTLQEIAAELGVSRERVRQLEAKAIQKLRQIASGMDIANL
ncbi:MAG: sigma-70 family RNA polymerase sigma factor [Planctomycetaceae bacterium]|nr:sigma-70 family RNA polymerase sigma factor [Planctomycetales bacterium]MCB9927699.1 sigma-70 family RNA polymerase sigma factor [Planctomycetaceae bacterium]